VIYKETPLATTARGRELIAWLTCDALDRQQEVVRAEGGTFTSPLPVLLNHDHMAIVGTLYRIEPERLSSGETCLRGHLRLLPPGTSKVADEAAASWKRARLTQYRLVSLLAKSTPDRR
jgi:hypothetical protein